MRYLLILLLVGCVTTLTEEQAFQKEYDEADRKIQYLLWEKQCITNGGFVFTYRPSRPCVNKRNCIPHRWDWKYDNEHERAKQGNKTVCLARGQMRDIFR